MYMNVSYFSNLCEWNGCKNPMHGSMVMLIEMFYHVLVCFSWTVEYYDKEIKLHAQQSYPTGILSIKNIYIEYFACTVHVSVYDIQENTEFQLYFYNLASKLNKTLIYPSFMQSFNKIIFYAHDCCFI